MTTRSLRLGLSSLTPLVLPALILGLACLFASKWGMLSSDWGRETAAAPGTERAAGTDGACEQAFEDPSNPVLGAGGSESRLPLAGDPPGQPVPTLAPPEPLQLPPAGEVLTVRLEAELVHPAAPSAE